MTKLIRNQCEKHDVREKERERERERERENTEDDSNDKLMSKQEKKKTEKNWMTRMKRGERENSNKAPILWWDEIKGQEGEGKNYKGQRSGCFTFVCWSQSPFRFRGMFVSIFARTTVILLVTRHTWAIPSCITMAARSAVWVGSHASSVNHHT